MVERWAAAEEALPLLVKSTRDENEYGWDDPPCMLSDQPLDLVQDAATDCSFVASLCACAPNLKHLKV